MSYLTIESATPRESVAVVARDGVVAASREVDAGRSRTEELLAAVDRVLGEAGVAPRDLDGIVVSSGPGRFTGLRVGLATAKGLALASGLPLFAAPTLRALALAARAGEAVVCPLLDARRGEVYGAVFEGAPPKRLTPDVALSPGGFAEHALREAGTRPVVLVGTGAIACRSELAGAMGDAAVFPEPMVAAPGPASLLAAADLSSPVDLASFEPAYVRGVVAPPPPTPR